MPLDPKQIIKRREKMKLTARQAAARAGFGTGAGAFRKWMQLEAGTGDPSLAEAESVVRVLGCTVDELLAKAIRQNLAIAEGQLRDYQARLGKPFTY